MDAFYDIKTKLMSLLPWKLSFQLLGDLDSEKQQNFQETKTKLSELEGNLLK
jgi:hypothetical protein